MWFPTDDGFLAQENVAHAPMATTAADVNASVATAAVAAAVNATNAAVAAVSGPDQELIAQIVCVALVALMWLILCGVCRLYIFCPCPCCFCYIPCCCGYCLKSEPKRHPNDHYVQHDVRFYGGKPKRRGYAEVPAYGSHAVDMEEPLLGAPSYSNPPALEAPPAYHQVPTAPPLS